MTLIEKLIYIEEGIRQLKDQVIETKLSENFKQKFDFDLEIIKNQIDTWRWDLTL